MKFKLKQPTKYMHELLQKEDSDFSEHSSNGEKIGDSQKKNDKKDQNINNYKKKKTITKKNEPSATRLNKINQTFQNIYHKSAKLFSELNIDEEKLNTLAQVKNKNKCLCNKNVKFYCLKCMQKVCSQPFPFVDLPFNVEIIHHESQKINKSSAVPLQFLTTKTKIHTFSSEADEKNQKLWKQLPKPGKGVYILFPHKQSHLISQIFQKQNSNNEYNKLTHLIILDCTWFQTDQILQILKGKGYKQYVRIEGYKSLYWRYNHHNEEALSSVESIAFFMRQYQKNQSKIKSFQQKNLENKEQLNYHSQNDVKRYDNLLFLYCLNLKMILKDQESRNQIGKIQGLQKQQK